MNCFTFTYIQLHLSFYCLVTEFIMNFQHSMLVSHDPNGLGIISKYHQLTILSNFLMNVLSNIDPITNPTWTMWVLFWRLSIFSYPLYSVFWARIYPWQVFCLMSWNVSFLKNLWGGILLKILEIPVNSVKCHPILWRNTVRMHIQT